MHRTSTSLPQHERLASPGAGSSVLAQKLTPEQTAVRQLPRAHTSPVSGARWSAGAGVRGTCGGVELLRPWRGRSRVLAPQWSPAARVPPPASLMLRTALRFQNGSTCVQRKAPGPRKADGGGLPSQHPQPPCSVPWAPGCGPGPLVSDSAGGPRRPHLLAPHVRGLRARQPCRRMAAQPLPAPSSWRELTERPPDRSQGHLVSLRRRISAQPLAAPSG